MLTRPEIRPTNEKYKIETSPCCMGNEKYHQLSTLSVCTMNMVKLEEKPDLLSFIASFFLLSLPGTHTVALLHRLVILLPSSFTVV